MNTQKKATATAAIATKGASKPATPRKPAAPRKASAKKAAPRKTAAKPPQTAVSKVAAPFDVAGGQPGTKIIGHGIPAAYDYPGMGKGGAHDITAAVTMALAIVSGLITMSKGGTPAIANLKRYSEFKALTAGKLHRKEAWPYEVWESGAAIVKLSSRLAGKHAGYNTTAELVNAILALSKKGGESVFTGKNGNPIKVTLTKPVRA